MLRVDFTLLLGERAEIVEVTDAVAPVNTETSRLSQTVDATQIANFPLNGLTMSTNCNRFLGYDSIPGVGIRIGYPEMHLPEE